MKLLRLPFFILFSLIAVAVSAEIKTPAIEDDFTDDTIEDPHVGRRRSRYQLKSISLPLNLNATITVDNKELDKIGLIPTAGGEGNAHSLTPRFFIGSRRRHRRGDR